MCFNNELFTQASKECLSFGDRGNVTIRIRFESSKMAAARQKAEVEGTLEVVVKQARGLIGIHVNGLSDPFCIW